ncbi:hypothetical protein FOMG_19719 [Fusarium oxysporum f. sp. melonis 26406]|uniref:Secreted protein n=1 Tax=Fusarium oxysporum f. sp. melonis 26406 TaxID=1089452 RepID=W9YVD8_FUSOX|nr:hypothetical protein FOMG_19719 [Fusarium oxysporum f. sp. melonis 26406]
MSGTFSLLLLITFSTPVVPAGALSSRSRKMSTRVVRSILLPSMDTALRLRMRSKRSVGTSWIC